jgi:hypothetical protein
MPDPFPLDTYVAQGIIFTGFGTNGGAVFLLGNDNLGDPVQQQFISSPNALSFISITTNTDGGLVQSPETLSFYPPVTSLQFDVTTIGLQCGSGGGAASGAEGRGVCARRELLGDHPGGHPGHRFHLLLQLPVGSGEGGRDR